MLFSIRRPSIANVSNFLPFPLLLFLFLPDFFERGDKMVSLRFSDVFKSLNVAYGIEKEDSVNFNVSTGATNYLSSQSEASDVNKRFNDIGDVDSYFNFCEPLLQAKGADSTENLTLLEISNEEAEVIARDSVQEDIIAKDGKPVRNSKKSKIKKEEIKENGGAFRKRSI